MSSYPPPNTIPEFNSIYYPQSAGANSTQLRQIADNTDLQKDLYGNLSSVVPINTISNYFNSDIINSSKYVQNTTGSSTISAFNGECEITCGSGSHDLAQLRSKRILKYRSGYTSIATFGVRFDTPSVNTIQYVGLGIASSHIYFGYNSSGDFVFETAKDGEHTIYELQITGASTGSENATITLDGTAFSVPLTNAGGDVNFTTEEISVFDYDGWTTTHIADVVVFAKEAVGVADGTYSFSSSTATATFTKQNDGVAISTTTTTIDDFNGDSTRIQNLNPQRFNMYRIQFSFYGVGDIQLSVYDPDQLRFKELHTYTFANSSTELNLTIANYYIQQISSNFGGAGGKTLRVGGSSAGYIGAQNINGFVPYSAQSSKTISSGTETNMIAIKHRDVINNRFVNAEIIIRKISVAADGNRAVIVRCYINPTLSPTPTTSDFSDFQYVDEDESVALFDTNSTTFSGGKQVLSFVVSKAGQVLETITEQELLLGRGDVFLLTCESVQSSEVDVSISFNEDT